MKSCRAGLPLEGLFFALAALCMWATSRAAEVTPRGFDLGPRPAESLRVVTWNLGTGVQAGTQGLRNDDLEHVAGVLHELGPDLIFLQELTGRFQMRRLEVELGEGWNSEIRRLGTGRTLGVLARGGSLQELDSASLERAHGVEFRRPGGLHLRAVTLHADAFSAAQRNRSIGRALDWLGEGPGAARTLLAGDLNLDLDLDKRRDLFTDDQNLDLESYNYVAQRMQDAGLGSGPTADPDRRIDYLFVRSEEFQVLRCAPFLGRRSPGMDHDPLVADLIPLN